MKTIWSVFFAPQHGEQVLYKSLESEGMLRLLSLRQDWYLSDQVLGSHSWEDPISGLTRGQEKSGSFKHLKPMNKLRFRHISHVKRVASESDLDLDSTSGKENKGRWDGQDTFHSVQKSNFPPPAYISRLKPISIQICESLHILP